MKSNLHEYRGKWEVCRKRSEERWKRIYRIVEKDAGGKDVHKLP